MATSDFRQRAREALVNSYGVEPPTPIVQLYAMALEHGENQRALAREATLVSFYSDPYYCFIDSSLQLTCDAPLEPATPAPPFTVLPALELFEFAQPGMNGVQYGFVVHAPELERTDYPLAEWAPRGGQEAIHGLGATSREGLERLLSRTLAQWQERPPQDPDARNRLFAFARAIDVSPDAAKAPAFISEEGDPPRPEIPPGWRFEQTIDGIGVLAPAVAFGLEQDEVEDGSGGSLEDVVAIAERALAAEHPASALWLLRNELALEWSAPGATGILAPAMQRAYCALGRPLLANMLGRCVGPA